MSLSWMTLTSSSERNSTLVLLGKAPAQFFVLSNGLVEMSKNVRSNALLSYIIPHSLGEKTRNTLMLLISEAFQRLPRSPVDLGTDFDAFHEIKLARIIHGSA